jgi:hypothetical protein
LPFDVFISHASKDKTVANAVCARLEAAGIRCWIAPRDIVAGTSYGEAIIDAIHAAKIMVLVFSANANASAQIPKEIERAVSNGVAILPFRIEDVAPGKSLDYFIGSVHWLDAMTPPMEKHLDSLAETVHKLLGALSPAPIPAPIPPPPPPPIPPPMPAPLSKTMLIGVAGAVLLAALVLGVILVHHSVSTAASAANPIATNSQDASDNSNSQSPSSPRNSTRAGSDPIVGCYQWFNNGPVVIRSDHSIVGGPITGHWQLVDAASQAYKLTWQQPKDTVTVAPNQLSLSGTNSYGPVTTGARMAGFSGLVGTWRWENGATVVVSQNGQVAAGSILGTWQPISVAQGTYTITWMAPIDSVTLVAGGSRISGESNYGVAISGMRTEPCDQN